MKRVDDGPERISILIAVAVRLYRDGLAAALGAQERLQVKATAGPPEEVLAVVRTFQPDVVIIDASLGNVLELMRALRAASPHSRLLAFAVGEEIDAILNYAEAGADAFFSSNGSLAELIEAIERTADGELLCSPRVAAQLLRHAACRDGRKVPPSADHRLTRRERQVFDLLKQGRSNKEIASELRIAEATVKNHVHHLLEKMQVTTRGKAAAVRGVWLDN